MAHIGLDDIDPTWRTRETHITGKVGPPDGNPHPVASFDKGAGSIASNEAGAAEKCDQTCRHARGIP